MTHIIISAVCFAILYMAIAFLSHSVASIRARRTPTILPTPAKWTMAFRPVPVVQSSKSYRLTGIRSLSNHVKKLGLSHLCTEIVGKKRSRCTKSELLAILDGGLA